MKNNQRRNYGNIREEKKSHNKCKAGTKTTSMKRLVLKIARKNTENGIKRKKSNSY